MIKLNKITIGTLELMNQFGCQLMESKKDDLMNIMGYIYIHSEDFEKLIDMSQTEFNKNVKIFANSISITELNNLKKVIEHHLSEISKNQFEVSDDKKKA